MAQELFTITLKNGRTTLDPKFLACYLAVNQINYADLGLTKSRNWTIITNREIIDDIKMRYQHFLLSGNDLDEFFNRQIVIVRETRGRKSIPQFIIQTEEITTIPVFITVDGNRRVKHGANFKQFTAPNPIKMPIDLIFQIHGKICPEGFPINFPDYVETYPVISGDVIRNKDASGKSKSPEVIRIGQEGANWYWIPDEKMIVTEYTCTKFPRKCLYTTDDWTNFKRHESTCTDQTIIVSKQVSYELCWVTEVISYGPCHMTDVT